MTSTLSLLHGQVNLPVFLPDATLGVVRGVDCVDLQQLGLPALMMNVFHLMQKPGSSTIQALGGLHQMTGWTKPIFTDSGGFQAYSLVRQNEKFGKLSDKGISFQPEGASRKFQLTPEKSIQRQLAYGADVIYCLDDCTHVDDPLAEQETSVARTIAWAKRSKQEFERQLAQRQWSAEARPQLYAIVQGGGERSLRQECAAALLEIGFDGYGYGGWPLDADNQLLVDMLAFTRAQIPRAYPMHALGLGHPAHIVTGFRLGYHIFDSAMPTRDARHARLYCFTSDPRNQAFSFDDSWFQYRYLQDRKYVKDRNPISTFCDCHTCQHYALGYLHHLFKCKDTLFYRLTTIHNLAFMMQLMRRLRNDDEA